MGLESGNYIYDLVQSNPPAGDQRKEGDDHLRLIKKIMQQTFPHITGPTLPVSTGSANAQLVTHLFAPPAYLPGQIVAFVAGFTNTGPMTLAVNGGAAKNFYIAGAPVGAGNVVAGGLYLAMYDGVQFQMAGAFGIGGYLPLTGGTITGGLTAPSLAINGAAATARQLVYYTASSPRWNLQVDASAEGGSNAGSNFTINRYTDAGAFIDAILTINRASGVVSIAPGAGAGANLVLNTTAAANHNILSQVGGLTRWNMNIAFGAEGGSNSGSDFAISRYNDAGAAIDNPITIKRSDGNTTFAQAVALAPAAGTAPQLILNKATTTLENYVWGQRAGVNRWRVTVGDAATETGTGNAGCNFSVVRYTDAGAFLDVPLSIARGTGVATFGFAIVNGPSDRSLKENIAPLKDSLDKVMALKGVSFNFIKDKAKRQIGLIAQDVAPIVPEVMQDFIQPNEEPKLAIDYTRLVPVLIEAIKELTARLAAVEARLEEVNA